MLKLKVFLDFETFICCFLLLSDSLKIKFKRGREKNILKNSKKFLFTYKVTNRWNRTQQYNVEQKSLKSSDKTFDQDYCKIKIAAKCKNSKRHFQEYGRILRTQKKRRKKIINSIHKIEYIKINYTLKTILKKAKCYKTILKMSKYE